LHDERRKYKINICKNINALNVMKLKKKMSFIIIGFGEKIKLLKFIIETQYVLNVLDKLIRKE
jgi:hypothetical protein